MIKYLALFLVVALCGYIGYGFSSFYSNRKQFFKSLELLFDKFKAEISFSQNKLLEILQSFSSYSKDAKRYVQNFVNCLNYDKELSQENVFEGIKILNDDEKSILLTFTKTLGKFDAPRQVDQLANQKQEILNLYNKAEEDAKKYGSLYIKLGVILGLVIALIFA